MKFTTTTFREIVKKLQAFGLINIMIEQHKLTDNTFIQLFIYFDDFYYYEEPLGPASWALLIGGIS